MTTTDHFTAAKSDLTRTDDVERSTKSRLGSKPGAAISYSGSNAKIT